MSFQEKLVSRLKCLLENVDPETTSERQLRRALEDELGAEVKNYKGVIKQVVLEYIEKLGEDEDKSEPPGQESPVGKTHLGNSQSPVKELDGQKAETEAPKGPLYVLSPEMAEFVGVPKLQRTQCLKRVWEHIKANGLQDGRAILPDGQLERLFEFPLDAGLLMKQIGRHMVEKVEGAPGAAAGSRKKKRKPEAGDGGDGKKRAAGGYQKPLGLSPELAEFAGTESMSRPEAVKMVWAYIKENELQDPSNKRNVLCDDRLRGLFGVDKFQGFSMMKFLNRHFVPD
uniref:Upstream activation factor subunit UAF30 n=1 Tax=Tetraselmis sp. GSL018 TaxID=582737 RepID=A0A061RXD4_9CHLO|mmetsp:Transcript_25263/g.60122  ORF Transcript_25263/g.60122 Transcript_25263/m.60122 type:complete len:285 (+) Transcript_25263:203-1057(+)|eukprot:CAMPEP_0177606600 /NCGR_PEP_ID=MMETSP0419_2-20121207/17396_1 /TAXON_ID=582737 /ORGANISM="Tetraselmis sp., Strain GSL018" /LENGTH=284 /DNA_ID=CAMNT_0019100977 /DNA_START=112 /DNA_END=966 /DNA_ORIENTATION=-